MGKYEEIDKFNIIPQSKEVYVLHYKGSPFSLSPFNYEQCIEKELPYWQMPKAPPRKIYYTLGRAKQGIRQLPDEMQDKVEIVKYTPENIKDNR